MEKWLKEIDSKFRSGASHTFLLHLNVADAFLVTDDAGHRLEYLIDRLTSSSPLSEARFMAFFNLGEGIKFRNNQMEDDFLQFLEMLMPEKLPPALGEGNVAVYEFKKYRGDLGYALKLFSKILKISWKDVELIIKKNAAHPAVDVLPIPEKLEGRPFFGVVVEYLETIVPPASSSTYEKDRIALVSTLVLAKHPKIRSANNIVFFLCEGLSSVANQLKPETNAVTPVKVDFPDLKARQTLYGWLRKNCPANNMSSEIFARHSAGMSSSAIVSLLKEADFKGESLTITNLFERKKKFIEDQSGGLVEIVRPLWGIKAIGGLKEKTECILGIVKRIKSGSFSSVPTGILLLGAPGTGKTVFAQAVAYESDIPFVILKNIREMWVGSSERNLDFALELILALAPVVVFIDEIDQEMQMRSSGPVGDSGVNQRIQSRLFQFMSDTNLRGKVMWIAASNRPDLIDPALLRDGRFDDKIPFFPPSTAERLEIIPALLHKFEVIAQSMGTSINLGEISDKELRDFARRAHCHTKDRGIFKCNIDEFHSLVFSDDDTGKDCDDEIYFTGGMLENIIRRAIEYAERDGERLTAKYLLEALEDYMPPMDMAAHQKMTEMAMQYCNSMRFMPKEGRWHRKARELRLARHSTNTAKPNFS